MLIEAVHSAALTYPYASHPCTKLGLIRIDMLKNGVVDGGKRNPSLLA